MAMKIKPGTRIFVERCTVNRQERYIEACRQSWKIIERVVHDLGDGEYVVQIKGMPFRRFRMTPTTLWSGEKPPLKYEILEIM